MRVIDEAKIGPWPPASLIWKFQCHSQRWRCVMHDQSNSSWLARFGRSSLAFVLAIGCTAFFFMEASVAPLSTLLSKVILWAVPWKWSPPPPPPPPMEEPDEPSPNRARAAPDGFHSRATRHQPVGGNAELDLVTSWAAISVSS